VVRALVADRSATTRRVVIRALRVVGVHDVLEFADLHGATAALAGDPDIVVIDWSATDDAALQLITDLRARESGAHAKVIVLSERDRRSDLERAIALGIQGYVLKPLETQLLVEQLAAAMQTGENATEAA
jgi:DNA-binding NarL/FixJ family response regulator